MLDTFLAKSVDRRQRIRTPKARFLSNEKAANLYFQIVNFKDAVPDAIASGGSHMIFWDKVPSRE